MDLISLLLDSLGSGSDPKFEQSGLRLFLACVFLNLLIYSASQDKQYVVWLLVSVWQHHSCCWQSEPHDEEKGRENSVLSGFCA